MNRYEPRTPRALFAFTAVAITAATFGLAVAAPAAMVGETQEIGVLTRNEATPSHATRDGAMAAIDVVVVRGTRLVPVMHRANPPKQGLQG